jgi:hypothetical protein
LLGFSGVTEPEAGKQDAAFRLLRQGYYALHTPSSMVGWQAISDSFVVWSWPIRNFEH